MKSADTDGGNFYGSPTFNALRESYHAVDHYEYGYIGDTLSPAQAEMVVPSQQRDELMMTLQAPAEGFPLSTGQQDKEPSSPRGEFHVRREISF